MNHSTLLFLGVEDLFEAKKCDKTYAAKLKPMVGQIPTYVRYTKISTITEVEVFCKSKGITGVFSTNSTLLTLLVNKYGGSCKEVKLDNYAGSMFECNGIEYLFINRLDQLYSITYMSFLTKRFISKLVEPSSWTPEPEFNLEIIDASNQDRIYQEYKNAFAIAVDIETLKEDTQIKCIGFTGVFISSGNVLSTRSCVIPLMGCGLPGEEVLFNLAIARKFVALKAPKIFQKGKYDLSYLSRWNIIVENYLWDTATLFHCWYSEIPKDLAFLNAFFIRRAMYWKDLAQTADLYTYFKYNALDTQATALVWIQQMLQMPQWARDNYLAEFPCQFPAHLCDMTGIKRDMIRLESARAEVDKYIEEDTTSLSKMVGVYPQTFNTNSSTQNKALRTILGCKDIESSNEASLKVIANRHPLNSVVANKILDIRGNRKLRDTYLTTEDKAKEFQGRILFTTHMDGTDTGRCSSSEHSFWCGLQIQNIPRGKWVKQTLMADEGFLFAECDLKQAETRGTAYIAGDTKLMAAVEGDKDFHAWNASCFFGVPYEEIYDDIKGKTLNKILRDLAKRVNHGANYLMGARVLLETMGETMVWEAKRLLDLPKHYSLLDVTQYLLDQFHTTYPFLGSVFYPGIVNDLMTKRMLVGATGWTRFCFNLAKNQRGELDKRAKNAYVAHAPQSLNAMILNKAFMKVFYTICLHPEYSKNFKLIAQIHDSILFQFREGHEYLAELVRKCMEMPIEVTGYDKVKRTMLVPADIKAGVDGKGVKYWSDTE